MTKEKHYKIKETGDFELILGSHNECDYALVDFSKDISQRHAIFKREDDRLFLKDLNSVQGTFINGKKIGSKWCEITLNDQVFLGKIPIEIGPTLLLGRERQPLVAQNIYYTIPNKDLLAKSSLIANAINFFKKQRKIICNNV